MDKSSGFLIVIPSVLLSILSLAMLASVAPEKLLPQATFSILAVLVGWIVYRVGVRNILLVSPVIYGMVLFSLIVTIFFGRESRGSIRWLELWETKIQASEVAKPALVLVTAAVLSSGWSDQRRFQLKKLAKLSLVVLPLVALVFLQPDLGTAIILTLIAITQLFCSGIPRWLIALFFLVGVLLVPLNRSFLADYQLARIHSFLDPFSDPRGSGYNVIQSMIAIGSGQLFGRGLGHGTQGQLRFLPERQTDFIFSSLVEELGLLGGIVVVSLYTVLGIGIFRIAVGSNRPEYYLIAIGCLGWLFFQSMINIAMNLGLTPVTGITLPLVSAGGSSLLASGILLGLTASIGAMHSSSV